MTTEREIELPDIGDFDTVDVIEVLVAAGDRVAVEDPLITLESDKATMEIPSPSAGVVKELRVQVGDTVSQGIVIAVINDEVSQPTTTNSSHEDNVGAVADPPPPTADPAADRGISTPTPEGLERQVVVPDIGDFDSVEVIEVLVETGDQVDAEMSLITLESDKATMEIPAPAAGTVKTLLTKVGDSVSEGSPIAIVIESTTAAPVDTTEPVVAATSPLEPRQTRAAPDRPTAPEVVSDVTNTITIAPSRAYASPSVRKFAREMGIDLAGVKGTGRKGRILKGDVKTFVKDAMKGVRPSDGFQLPEVPVVDFSKYGEIKTQALSKIKRLSGHNLHRSWITAPHVTQFDETDITELEDFRQENKRSASEQGVKLTMLSFLMKATVVALKSFPELNSSLSPDGESLIIKKYYHIGFAADTPQGLVVPVIRDVDKKGLYEIAKELQESSTRAREKKLSPKDMQGGSFTISSLGGIGGTAFTPIINVPEVAILGVAKSAMRPVYIDGNFCPRLILPFSLSYDHRVIDGAAAARFTTFLGNVMSDIRKVLL